MFNKSMSLMVQTILVLMEKQNSSGVKISFNDDMDLERCYEPYGCFSKAYPWTENRPDNYFPESSQSMRIRFPAFSRRNRRIPVLLEADNVTKISNANLDPKGPFYFISHGFLEGGDKIWIQNMAEALLNLEGNEAATVLVVDWRGGSQPPYGQAVANIRLVGAMTAHLINNIKNMADALLNLEANEAATVLVVDWRGGSQPPYGQAVANIRLVGAMTAHLINNIKEVLGLPNLDNFHFIGHSLGAHLGGYCGHDLQKKFNLKLGRITGLDPAAPYFSKTVTLVRLDRSDAKYVDIIHSNAMPLYYAGLGMSAAIGHVDFFPNGGDIQPGCKKVDNQVTTLNDEMYKWMVKSVGCSHERSYEFFTESISPSCPFMFIQCESYEAFLSGNCTSCSQKNLCIPMGYHSYKAYKELLDRGLVDTISNVALFGKTGSKKPFCRVHYEVALKVSNSTPSRTHGPDVGRVQITLIDRNNNKSDHKFLDEVQKYYKPGDIDKQMVAVRDTGLPPLSVMVEWKYETNLFNPITWRLLKSPSVYVEYVKLSSIEYNTDITVCPKMNKPVVANLPSVMKTKYCRF